MIVRLEPRWLELPLVAELLVLRLDSTLSWAKRRSGPYHGAMLRGDAHLRWCQRLRLQPANNPGAPREGESRIAILRAAVGCEISAHVDDTPRLVSQRIVMLQPALSGGVLTVEGVPCPLGPGDSCVFDANQELHWVTRVEGCERIALSIQSF